MNSFKTSFLLASVALLASASQVLASVQTDSNSCLAPVGSVIADYANGTHGIAGLGSKDGHDTVYQAENGVLQCLCATDGSGIQTNWISASNYSQDEIKVYQSQGWIYIPDGSAWGLSEGAYLAKNSDYSCGGGSTTTQSSQGDGKSDGKSDGRSDGMGSSIVQAATGNSGLASTGDVTFVILSFIAAVGTTTLGIWLRKNTK